MQLLSSQAPQVLWCIVPPAPTVWPTDWASRGQECMKSVLFPPSLLCLNQTVADLCTQRWQETQSRVEQEMKTPEPLGSDEPTVKSVPPFSMDCWVFRFNSHLLLLEVRQGDPASAKWSVTLLVWDPLESWHQRCFQLCAEVQVERRPGVGPTTNLQ